MTSATLPRVTKPIVPTAQDGSLDMNVLADAAQHLRYRGSAVLKGRITRGERKCKLYNALIAAGVFPLEEEAVRRYKKRVVRMSWLKPIGAQVAIVAGVLGSIALIPESVGILVAPVLIGAVASSIALWTTRQPINWAWRQFNIADYARPIPISVLKTAMTVNKLLPDLQRPTSTHFGGQVLSVEEFSYEKRVADPFLILHDRDYEIAIYIAAWDEPTFHG